MTSDGISKKDWQHVEELADSIVELSSKDSSTEFLEKRLIKYLHDLEFNYGRLPSILATKADYVTSSKEALILLKEAYTSALEISDFKNLTYISSSIAEYYAEELKSKKLDFWIERTTKHSLDYGDDYIKDALNELTVERSKM